MKPQTQVSIKEDRTNLFPFSKKFFTGDISLLIFLAMFKLAIHLIANAAGGYGYFRDEFYYIACSDHLDWGYVDQPPLSIAILWLNRLLFGDSLFALRLLPAIAGAVVVFLSGLIVKEFGGNKFAMILATCSVIVAPQLLGTNSYFSMNSFDVLFWILSVYLIVLIMKKDSMKYWLILGVVLGLGLLNKISVLWLGAGFFVGLILTSNRKFFLTRKVWITGAIALLLFLPHIIWQIVYHFPTLEFIRNATGQKYVSVSPIDMFIQQIMSMQPLTFPIWFTGLIYLLVSRKIEQFRILPIIYLTVFLILIINKNSKAEYLTPLFPMLFAAGSIAIEKYIKYLNWNWLKSIIVTLLIAGGVVTAPFAIAILPVEKFISHSQLLGITPSTPEKKELSRLPQHYADMFGWETLVYEIAQAYNTLTPEEKTKCAILTNNYGEAGAIDFFGGKYNLPKAISGHNNYWLWGPRNATGEVVIRLGGSIEAIQESYKDVIQAGIFNDDYVMPYENNMPVYICKNRVAPLKDDWLEFKHFE
jgi:hypothetical protein